MHPLTWSHWFSLQLHSDWQAARNPGYIHFLSQFNPVYPVWQALNKQYVRDEMKKIKAIRFETFHIKWKQFYNYTHTCCICGYLNASVGLKTFCK